ncbi:YoaK family protein [Nocardia macrotermitis]|uniref:DUF1275 domain-containing protein n=1 Tax=Nocardia macrotermitis TaxID=2585198 RepID=A0A7K0D9W4_9NOCA|nr:YoaK family protein [Nocardia macrotermitis]MQY22122.1 hypothetical protein [Nocardia macrotermitis]
MTANSNDTRAPFWDLEARLATALLILAGFVGAAAYTHSQGYFVTFMTGNTERAVIGGFLGDFLLARGALLLIVSFLAGVLCASVCRRRWWRNHPHGATVLATLALVVAAVIDGFSSAQSVGLVPILFVAFAMGSLNTSFVRNGETAIPVTYVTGTLVKLAQGIERHIAGGTHREWLGYAVQWFSFVAGAGIGGLVSLVVNGDEMLIAAAVGSALVAGYTWRADIRWVRRQEQADTGS